MAELTKEQREVLLKEYEIAEQLRNSYFSNSWVSTSIVLPITFGLVGVSFSIEPLLELTWQELIPLMLTSIFLCLFWLCYVGRYGAILSVIYERQRTIEVQLQMSLHRSIYEDKKPKFFRKGLIKKLNFIIILLLIFVWLLRLYFSPIVSSLAPTWI